MTDIDELRKLAEAADLNIDWIGAGPTRHGDLISTSGKPLFIDSVYLDCDEQDVDGDDYFVCSAGSDEYGRFIAAASPRTVIRLLDDLKAAEQQRDELIAQKFAEEPLRRQIAELQELGRFREKHSLSGSPEIYDDPSAAFHKFACETHDALKVGAGDTAQPVEFLLGGARLKLSFQQEECESCGASSAHFRTVPMDQYAEELQGCWVALVPAENDRHLRMVATHNAEFSGTPAALSPEAPLERRVMRKG